MKTTFFLDIDQTISTGYVGRDLAESVQYYRDLGLELPETIASWPDLFQLPAILARHEALPGALVGAWRLDGVGDVGYATVRAPDVEQITRDWLYREGFPKPERLVMCQSVAHKLQALSQYGGRMVLIDDRWHKALEVWPRLEEHAPDVAADLRQRLTLVAFGATQADLPESSVVPVVPLPTWASSDAVLMMMHEAVVPKKG
jgi:hypothetical protein